VYQLVAERDPDPRRRLEITERGSFAQSDDAREGLSKGVRSHYYDGLEEVTLDWFDQEKNPVVRGHLAEHFARFSNECGPYEEMAIRINELDSRLRERLLLGAEGKPLYSRLKAFETADLFAGVDDYDLVRAIRESAAAAVSLPQRKVLMFSASPL